MTEFALTLPLLMLVLALTMFFGWARVRQQHVVVASRYAVWRSFDTGWPQDELVRGNLFKSEGAGISRETRDGPLDAIELWSEAVYDVDEGAGVFADDCLIDRWPHGREIQMTVNYEPPLPVGKRLGGTMVFGHGREGVDWVRSQANERDSLRDLYYADMDALLEGIGTPGDRLAGRVRSLWNARW